MTRNSTGAYSNHPDYWLQSCWVQKATNFQLSSIKKVCIKYKIFQLRFSKLRISLFRGSDAAVLLLETQAGRVEESGITEGMMCVEEGQN